MKTHINSPIVKDNKGDAINKTQFAFVGITISLNKSFNPSANACNKPKNPVTFGPLRL